MYRHAISIIDAETSRYHTQLTTGIWTASYLVQAVE